MTEPDLAPFATQESPNAFALTLRVEGMHCAACAQRIAAALNAEKDANANVDLASALLTLRWKGEASRADALIAKAAALGYGFAPFAPKEKEDSENRESRSLRRCLWVSGVATFLLMALSALGDPVPFLAALIAIPSALYAGRPFYLSAFRALKNIHSNMDVPIAAAIILTLGLGLFALAQGTTDQGFDSVLMLIFLLLVGRALDARARGRARSAAEGLLAFMTESATIKEGDQTRRVPIRELREGMVLVVAAGEKIAADGVVLSGASEIDPAFITGETLAQSVKEGDTVFGGMINLLAPLQIRLARAAADSLPGEVLKLLQKAEQGQARYVRLADRAAKFYAPFVFFAALGGFALWRLTGHAWQDALQIAASVLVITCPCAMGLAVPAVQVIASTRLFKNGLLVKTSDALERLAGIDTIFFDKTGTLTEGRPRLLNTDQIPPEAFRLAASLASQSRHPLARALARSYKGDLAPLADPVERPGLGIEAFYESHKICLGRWTFCGDDAAPADEVPELWFAEDGKKPIRFVFEDSLRKDAAAAVAQLKKQGFTLALVSGDRPSVVASIAHRLGIEDFAGGLSPLDKGAAIEKRRASGKRVLMVGDGLNDAPALALADVSISPSTALDIAQNAASIVFQGESLAAIPFAIDIARRAQRLVKQNFALAFLYNVIAVPLALLGLVTPPLAAAFMSASSILVVLNAQRLRK
jgi:Cu2+-exporting ATPase